MKSRKCMFIYSKSSFNRNETTFGTIMKKAGYTTGQKQNQI